MIKLAFSALSRDELAEAERYYNSISKQLIAITLQVPASDRPNKKNSSRQNHFAGVLDQQRSRRQEPQKSAVTIKLTRVEKVETKHYSLCLKQVLVKVKVFDAQIRIRPLHS